MACCITVTATISVFAKDNATLTTSDKIIDSNGDILTYDIINIDSNCYEVNVYLNGVQTQNAFFDKSENLIKYTEFNNQQKTDKNNIANSVSINSSVTNYRNSDYLSETAPIKNSMVSDFSSIAANVNLNSNWDEWHYCGSYLSPILSGANRCYLYTKNYDEEPDLHKFMAKNISCGSGTPVGIVIGLVTCFASGSITPLAIILTIGGAISCDIITNTISAEVCLSTKKILYAPIINNTNIFPDAYITEKYLITHDYLRNIDNAKLVDSCYSSNRGQTPGGIAFNAQVAEMSM